MSVEYICWYWIYHAINVSWRVYVRPLGAGWENLYFEKYILVEYICWYWIYHANTWGMSVSWRVSVRPSGAGWENVHFWNMYQLNIFVGIGYIMPTFEKYEKITTRWRCTKLQIIH